VHVQVPFASSVHSAAGSCLLILSPQPVFSYYVTLSQWIGAKWNKHHWLSGPNEPILSPPTNYVEQTSSWVSSSFSDCPANFPHVMEPKVSTRCAQEPDNLSSHPIYLRFILILSSHQVVCLRFPNHNPECRSLPLHTCRTPESRGNSITVVVGRRCVSQTEHRNVFQTCCWVVLLCYRSKDDQFTCCLNRQSVGMFCSLRCATASANARYRTFPVPVCEWPWRSLL